jgi:porin
MDPGADGAPWHGSARVFVNAAFGWPTLPSDDLPRADRPSRSAGQPYGCALIPRKVGRFSRSVQRRPDRRRGRRLASWPTPPARRFAPAMAPSPVSCTTTRTAPRKTEPTVLGAGEIRRGSAICTWIRTASRWQARQATGKPFRHDGNFSLNGAIDQPFLYNDNDKTRFPVFARAWARPAIATSSISMSMAGSSTKGSSGAPAIRLALRSAMRASGKRRAPLTPVSSHFTGVFYPIRSAEAVLELTYRFQLIGRWQLQPDFQYIFNPGSKFLILTAARTGEVGIANPIAPHQADRQRRNPRYPNGDTF